MLVAHFASRLKMLESREAAPDAFDKPEYAHSQTLGQDAKGFPF